MAHPSQLTRRPPRSPRRRSRFDIGARACWPGVLALASSVVWLFAAPTPGPAQETESVQTGDTVQVSGYAMWVEDGRSVGRDGEYTGRIERIQGDTLLFAEGVEGGPDGVIMGRGVRPSFRVRRGERRQYGRGAKLGFGVGGMGLAIVRMLRGPDEPTPDNPDPKTAGEQALRGVLVGGLIGAPAGALIGLAFHGPNWVDAHQVGPTTPASGPTPSVGVVLRIRVP